MNSDLHLKEITERIKSMDESNKPIPFWSWNDRLDIAKLKKQIDAMAENGLGGFFMHARGGLRTEYLSGEWHNTVKFCAEYAETKGMKAWIYDENGWPSGFAGGKLLSEQENHDCYLTFSTGEYDKTADASYLVTENQITRVTDCKENGEYLNVFRHISPSTADILNPRVTDGFIELTHESYKKSFGDTFREQIGGFFTDEPQYYRWRTAYSDMMKDYFAEEYGQDIFDYLGLLFVEKEGYRLFRYRYWKAMQTLMLNNFTKKIYNWCETNGVGFTGHYVEENSIAWQMYCCGGIMPFYAYMTIPGIDWLGRRSSCEQALRQVASVAAQYGKKRIITESFGCCGWEVTPRDFRRIADFQYAGGINLMCEHLLPYSEHGQRKRDYPAHFLSANPWFDDEFKGFNRYCTRIGNLIAESQELINTAVLHPIRSVYFDFKRDADRPAIDSNTQFAKDLRLLSGAGISYHMLDETLLAEQGFVDGKKIGCNKCSYDFLILPHIVCMDESTEKLLKEYCKNGGKLLILGDKPEYREGLEYDYSYLSSNCTREDIIASQPFKIKDYDTEIFNTCRIIDDKMFLFADNFSAVKAYTQEYNFGDIIHSFRMLDLDTLEEKSVPLTVTLEAGQSALLFPDNAMPEEQTSLQEYTFTPDGAKICFKHNQLRVDHVRYSTDGVSYSKTYPCEGLFEKLIKERYDGAVYIKYEFEIREIPKELILLAEECVNSTAWLNGHEFEFTGRYEKEEHILTADISDLVRMGINEYIIKYDWHQGENVYYALFGDNVTEGLKNCLAYDTDLEAVYLSGSFGVYSDTPFTPSSDPNYIYGMDFYIGSTPNTVSEPVTSGFPFFTGTFTAKKKITLGSADTLLRLPGTWQTASVRVNGANAGRLVYKSSLDISRFAVEGENIIEVEYTVGLRNLLGAHHYGGGNENGNISPFAYELTGTWNDGESPYYAQRYNLIRFNGSEAEKQANK